MKPSEWCRFVYQSIPSETGPIAVSLWNRQTKHSTHLAPPVTAPEEFDKFVEDQTNLGRDVYYGVCLRRQHLTHLQRGKIQDVRGVPGLWLDIDFDRPVEAGENLPHASLKLPKTDAHGAEILSVMPPPTAIIDSGYGWHVYWLFDQVHPIGYIDEPGISHASELFQRKAIGHAAALGYDVDATYNIDRILRLPGTINTKTGKNTPVQVLFADGPRYGSINSLLDAAGIDARTTIRPSSISPAQAAEDISQELLEPRVDSAVNQTVDNIKQSLGNLSNPDSKELMKLVLDGKPFAPPGDRDRVLQRVASIIAYLAPDRNPEELARDLLGPSLQHHDDVDKGKYTQSDRIDWASEKIRRAQEDARRDRVIRERQNQALADVLLKQARSAPRRDQRLGPAPAGAYTDAEVEAYAKQQNTTMKDFAKRWIIQKGQSYYVYINGDYQLPLSAIELDVSLRRDLAPAVTNGFVSLETRNAKGENRPKQTKELLADYCSVARSVVARLDLGYSYYDEDTQTFFEATCPIRPLESAYCPEVDTWLKLLGGAKQDALLDWVATATNLTRQSAALYLQGPPGTGKSLLSQGLARLWHRGGPTELVRVLGEWSSDLARCPLVVADEQIPQSFKGQRTSAELRSLVGSSSRTLTRKFRDNADLVGAVRLILSANNADMLVFDESLSQGDLEAVAGRFLHISGDKLAQKYLNSIDTTGWVEDDVIAKHALWLRDRRTVVPGKRFLVEGSAQDVSKMLATRGGVAGRVAEWLVRYICDAKQLAAPAQAGLTIIGGGKYLVNTNAIVTFWDNYVKSSKVPSTPQVGSALRNLAVHVHRIGSKRYCEIDLEAICHWSESNLIGDPEIIFNRVSQALPETTT